MTTAWQQRAIGIMMGCTISPLAFTMAIKLIIQASQWVVGWEYLGKKNGCVFLQSESVYGRHDDNHKKKSMQNHLLNKLQENITWARIEIKPNKSCSISFVKRQLPDKPIPACTSGTNLHATVMTLFLFNVNII